MRSKTLLYRGKGIKPKNNFFQCGGYQTKGGQHCTAHYIREQVLDKIILYKLKQMTAFARVLRDGNRERRSRGKAILCNGRKRKTTDREPSQGTRQYHPLLIRGQSVRKDSRRTLRRHGCRIRNRTSRTEARAGIHHQKD